MLGSYFFFKRGPMVQKCMQPWLALAKLLRGSFTKSKFLTFTFFVVENLTYLWEGNN
jgi:hypothetical protein